MLAGRLTLVFAINKNTEGAPGSLFSLGLGLMYQQGLRLYMRIVFGGNV